MENQTVILENDEQVVGQTVVNVWDDTSYAIKFYNPSVRINKGFWTDSAGKEHLVLQKRNGMWRVIA